MKFWWLSDSERVALEKAAVEALHDAEPWFRLTKWKLADYRVAVEGEIIVDGDRYPVRLIYPDQFPDVPAWVEPQDAAAKWSSHQYGAGGPLCLEVRPDEWNVGVTGADVLRSAHNLLVHEKPLGDPEKRSRPPSAHSVGEIQSYTWDCPVLVSSGFRDRAMAGTPVARCGLIWPGQNKVVPVMLYDTLDGAQAHRVPTADAIGALDATVFVAPTAPPPSDGATRAVVLAAANLDGVDSATAPCAAVVFTFNGRLNVFLLIGDSAFSLAVHVLPDDSGTRSGRTLEASPRVAVIGAGSVGAKVADALVRSGVRRLHIVDGDVLLPGNLERHTLDWRDVGYKKVRALQKRLRLIAPAVDVTFAEDNLNWQRSAKTHARQVEQFAECDVIVDATGDAPTALFLGAVAAGNKKAFVSVEVFEGGIGCLIAASVPGRDPPFVVGRSAFLSWCEASSRPPPPRGAGDYAAFDDGGNVITADDAVVTVAAGYAARAVLDILDEKQSGSSSWLLVGLRNAWVFDGYGHNIRLSVGKPSDEVTEATNAGAFEFVAGLMKELEDATRASQ